MVSNNHWYAHFLGNNGKSSGWKYFSLVSLFWRWNGAEAIKPDANFQSQHGPYVLRMLAVSLSRSSISSIISSGRWGLLRLLGSLQTNHKKSCQHHLFEQPNSFLQLQIYSAPQQSRTNHYHWVGWFYPNFVLDLAGNTKSVWLGCL